MIYKLILVFGLVAIMPQELRASLDRNADSLAYILSADFSEISIEDESTIAVCLMERSISPICIQGIRNREEFKSGKGGDRLLLKLGDGYRFYLTDSGRELVVSVTNGLTSADIGGLPSEFCGSSLQVLVTEEVARRSGHCLPEKDGAHSEMTISRRSFVIDARDGRYFDIDRKISGEFDLPFHALWRDYKDFNERFRHKNEKPTAGKAVVKKKRRLNDETSRINELRNQKIKRAHWQNSLREEIKLLRQRVPEVRSDSANEVSNDVEMARLHLLFITADRVYPSIVSGSANGGSRPKSLRDLLEVSIPPKGIPLLPEGENDLKDIFGTEYRYRVEREDGKEIDRAVIVSAGPDGVFDTADDLSSEDYFRLRKLASEKEEQK